MICRCFTNKFVFGTLALASLSLFSIPASAQVVGWGNPAVNIPVPVGGIATIIEGVLLLVMGIYALYRKKGQFSIIAIVALTAGILAMGIGMYLTNNKAYAAIKPYIISITTPFGTADLKDGLNLVRNDSKSDVTITKIDPEDCELGLKVQKKNIAKENDIMPPICKVGMRLEPGESCMIGIICGDVG